MKTYYYIASSNKEANEIHDKLLRSLIKYEFKWKNEKCYFTTHSPLSIKFGFEEEFQSENKSYSPFEDSIGYHQSFGG